MIQKKKIFKINFKIDGKLAAFLDAKSKCTGITKSKLLREWLSSFKYIKSINRSTISTNYKTYQFRIDNKIKNKIDFLIKKYHITRSDFLRYIIENNVLKNVDFPTMTPRDLNVTNGLSNHNKQKDSIIFQKLFSNISNSQGPYNDISQAFNLTVLDSKDNIKVFTGKYNIKYIYEEILKSNFIFSFVNIEKFFDVFPELRVMFRHRIDSNEKMIIKDILVDNSLSAKNLCANRHSRYFCKIHEGVNFSDLDFIFNDKKLAIVKITKKDPVGILIDSPLVANTFKLLHSSIWKDNT